MMKRATCSVVVMLVAGGIAISDFMLVIALGIIIGSYSSLYIASPVIVFYNKIKGCKNVSADTQI